MSNLSRYVLHLVERKGNNCRSIIHPLKSVVVFIADTFSCVFIRSTENLLRGKICQEVGEC